MADDILTPGLPVDDSCENVGAEETPNYLVKDNYLGEFETSAEKEIARTNLGVPSLEDVYNKSESSILTKQLIQEALQQHLNEKDPHVILPLIDDKLIGVVKDDGSTPFKSPQLGVDPVNEYHLTTKKFVEDLLNHHLQVSDPHHIMDLVNEALLEYIKASQVYLKSEVYNKCEINNKLDEFVKYDGTVPFKRPQLGIDPKTDGHLTTKRYVDNLINEHLYDIDPHGFITTLNDRLSKYYRKTETYSKSETYSRTQIDSIINGLVADAAKSVIQDHINASDPHGTLEQVRSEHYVKRDGSIPFLQPQAGVPAVNDNELVTLSQLNNKSSEIQESINKEVSNYKPIWITSGPVRTTVGFVEDNTEPQAEVTFQEIMDAIFYGQAIEVHSPKSCVIGHTVRVEMLIHGLLSFSKGELYQDEQLIGTFYPEDFTDGNLTVVSLPIFKDTTFKFKVTMENGVEHEDTSLTKVSQGVFVGILSRWYSGYNVTYDYLEQLALEDPENNTFEPLAGDVLEIIHNYNFTTPNDLKQLVVAIPKDYPDLASIKTPAQDFGVEAFDIINDIPFVVPGVEENVIYKLYIYRQPLAMYHSEVTFKFKA